MGQGPIQRAGERSAPLRLAPVMMAHPGLMRQVRADFLAPGARVAPAGCGAARRVPPARAGIAARSERPIDRAPAAAGRPLRSGREASDAGPGACAEIATGRVAAGAGIVGGCGETTPAPVAELHRRRPAAGQKVA